MGAQSGGGPGGGPPIIGEVLMVEDRTNLLDGRSGDSERHVPLHGRNVGPDVRNGAVTMRAGFHTAGVHDNIFFKNIGLTQIRKRGNDTEGGGVGLRV
jgi:hypothetical protein